MKTLINLLLAAVLLLFLACGCVQTEDDTLYNNSGQELAITIAGDTNSVVIVKNGGSSACSRFMEVHCGSKTWHYPPTAPLAIQFRKKSGEHRLKRPYRRGPGNSLLVNLQMEPDGKIYLIPADSKGIVTNLPPQPEGFPLIPQYY